MVQGFHRLPLSRCESMAVLAFVPGSAIDCKWAEVFYHFDRKPPLAYYVAKIWQTAGTKMARNWQSFADDMKKIM